MPLQLPARSSHYHYIPCEATQHKAAQHSANECRWFITVWYGTKEGGHLCGGPCFLTSWPSCQKVCQDLDPTLTSCTLLRGSGSMPQVLKQRPQTSVDRIWRGAPLLSFAASLHRQRAFNVACSINHTCHSPAAGMITRSRSCCRPFGIITRRNASGSSWHRRTHLALLL